MDYIKLQTHNKMELQQKVPPILIYYNMRGQAQAIRGFFCYLQVQFIEIHLESFDEQRKILPLSVINKLKNQRIDKSLLPILIDQQQTVCDTYQIMAYLCYKHKQEHLLGTTLRQKAILQEIMEVYTVRQPLSMLEFFRFAEYAATHSKDEMYKQMKKSYSNLMENSQYIKQLCMHIRGKDPQRYVLSNNSILDFLFLQSCIYMVGVFDVIAHSHKDASQGTHPKDSLVNGVKYGYIIDLRVMRNFRDRMLQEPFYIKNQDFLESFSIVTPLINQIKIKGIKKMWIGNPRLIK